MKYYKRVLTIAGSDSGGCAGIQADIKTITCIGCFASSVITAVTAQNTLGVNAVQAIPAELVGKQIDAVLSDVGTDAIKIGMLATSEIVEVVAEKIKEYGIENVVLDPVLVSTSGHSLASDGVSQMISEQLFPLSTVVTPNIPEAHFFTGENDSDQIWNVIKKMRAKSMLLKGGHLDADDMGNISDVLYTGKNVVEYQHRKCDTSNTHGTGCSLSSAIASYLALGYELQKAVELAIEWEENAIISGANYVLGGGHGPIDHFWEYRNK